MKMKPQHSQFEKQPVYLNAQTERKCEKTGLFEPTCLALNYATFGLKPLNLVGSCDLAM